jgi:hypothetical protein
MYLSRKLRKMSSDQRPNAGLDAGGGEGNEESSLLNLATHVAWTLAEVSRDFSLFYNTTGVRLTGLYRWLNYVWRGIARHLLGIRGLDGEKFKKHYDTLSANIVLTSLRAIHARRSQMAEQYTHIDRPYTDDHSRQLQVISRLPNTLKVYDQLVDISAELGIVLEELDRAKSSRFHLPSDAGLSKLGQWTLSDVYNQCCNVALVITGNLGRLTQNGMDAQTISLLKQLIDWGEAVFDVEPCPFHELLELDPRKTQLTQRFLQRVFAGILAFEGKIRARHRMLALTSGCYQKIALTQ